MAKLSLEPETPQSYFVRQMAIKTIEKVLESEIELSSDIGE